MAEANDNANPFRMGQHVRLLTRQGPTMTVVGKATAQAEGQMPYPVVTVFWLDKEDRVQVAALPVEAVATLQ